LDAMSFELSVERLAASIDAQAPGGSNLERLSAAATTARELRDVADQLLDRYVQAARAQACSWAQIGEALGVTKQAAHERFTVPAPEPPVWPEQFSAPAGGVIAAAQREARSLGHRYPGTEHVLLALTADDGLARTV